jgi:thiol-disulfide isomerase/thioredoxin
MPGKQSKNMLGFQLYDVYGRMVDSQDYAGLPVLVMFGSCWCGGCQQDAEPFRQLAEEYAGKRLLCIRTVAGDNELAALDFQNHYRLPMVQLLDTNRAFEKKYNPDGWTFLMLCDRQGKVVYKVNSPREEDWKKLRAAINVVLEKPAERHAVMRDGTIYMPATLKRSGELDADKACQRFASIACSPNGRIYVVFTAIGNETNDVLMRWFDGATWSQDISIAATSAQEYDATVLADSQNRIWISWTSNANNGHYDIFLTSFTNPSQIEPAAAVTQYEDDAMHGRMASDKDGGIWMTYYKWRKMGQYSRDKEVYLRRFANKVWSKEIQISPMDVPEYEDHSDPSISICGNWVLVAWSWDFHPPVKGYSAFAELPTIFIRPVNRDMTLEKISSVSSKNIDLMPAVGVSGNQRFWCAWDSQFGSYKKQVCIANPTMGTDVVPGRIQTVCDAVKNVCTPTFVQRPDGGLTLLWSQTEDGNQWTLRMANLDNAKNQWSQPATIESNGSPRFAGGAYDKQGQLWVAYSEQTEQGRKVLVKEVDTTIEASEPNSISTPQAVSNTNNLNIQAVRTLRRLVDEKYSYRDLRGVDWDKMFSIYGPKMERAGTKEEFAEIAAKMLSFAKDMHLWVKIDDRTIGGFKRDIQRNYRMDMLEKNVPNWTRHNDRISTGRFEGGIGYILIANWDTKDKSTLEPAFEAMKTFSDCHGLIIDVRPNGGGGEGLASEFAGCFIDKPILYSKHINSDVKAPGGWGKINERILKPAPNHPSYRGKIVVLMGQANMSSCESFLLMMKQIPNCKLIGDKSYGSSGNPKPYDLGNGVTVWLPSWKDLFPDGSCLEGVGIRPDIPVKANENELRQRDAVLEKALKYMQSSKT